MPTLSPNMGLQVPSIGVDPAPQYGQYLNNSLTIVDGHDHSSGSGVQIGTPGINIQSDLTLNGNNLTSIRALRMGALSLGSLSASDNAAVVVSGVDLYYRDGNGNNVRLTQSGSIVGTTGSISGLSSPASASYVAANSTFVWQSAVNTAANMDCGSIVLRPTTASANGVTIAPPSGLGANYTVTLPASTPASTLPLQMDNSGTVSAAVPGSFVPAGAVLPYFGTSAPSGYLLCDGTSYARTDYAALFSAIGTSCGSADSTHFNVPDLRGQFLRGVTGTSSTDPDASSRTAMNTGGNTGNNVGSVQSGQIQSHTHTGTLSNAQGVTPTAVQTGGGASGVGVLTNGTVTINATGGNETRPVNAYCNYIIKT